MEKLYTIKFKPHKRTSFLLKNICSVVVSAKNKESAKELGQSIVRGFYNGDNYYIKQGCFMDWMQELLFEYVIKNQIRTNSENIKAVCEYAIKQGYNESIGLFCDALLADSEMLSILERGVI